jgi:hypothetical protein
MSERLERLLDDWEALLLRHRREQDAVWSRFTDEEKAYVREGVVRRLLDRDAHWGEFNVRDAD